MWITDWLVDRRAADAGDWSVGDEYQAAVPGDQRCSDDAGYNDDRRRCHVAVDRRNRRHRRHQKQSASPSTSETFYFSIDRMKKKVG